MTRSLRTGVLAWVMLPLVGAVAVDGWISRGNASETASVVQERLLLGSARMVAESLRFEDDAFQDHIPPAALELFDSGPNDRIYYRVTTPAGQLVAGYPELAIPAGPLRAEVPHFFSTEVRGQPVRAVAFLQPVVTEPGMQAVLVEIAQTLDAHDALTRSLWWQAMRQQVVILALVTVLILFGLRHGLKPLLRLRDTVAARAPGDLQPLALAEVPLELAPLGLAINDYAWRLQQYATAQRVFIQNAAHQLRTPLTLLHTQVSYGIRSAEPAARAESLAAIRQTVQQAVRLVNQLLILSSAEAHAHDDRWEEPVALDAIVRSVLENLSGLAHAKDIDLGFESAGGCPMVLGQPTALREITTNLLDNAIRYTQRGGIVTSRLVAEAAAVVLSVEDNGPGIPEDQRVRVFERFYRLHDHDSGGCGLGLPIVQEFASRMGASVAIEGASGGSGVTIKVTFRRDHAASALPLPDTASSGSVPVGR